VHCVFHPKNQQKQSKKSAKFGGFFVFLGQVKTERDAGICQPLGARGQGFFHESGFGHLGAVCGAF
jgi:hypothetical protein